MTAPARIVVCAFGSTPHPIDDECQDARDVEEASWVSTANCAHASFHVHGEDGRCQHEPKPVEPAAGPATEDVTETAELDELGPAEWAFTTLLRIAMWGLRDSRGNELREVTKEARARYRATNQIAEQAAPCCDLHGRNCEQGGEECCSRCAEAHHFAPGHGGVPCSAPVFATTQEAK